MLLIYQSFLQRDTNGSFLTPVLKSELSLSFLVATSLSLAQVSVKSAIAAVGSVVRRARRAEAALRFDGCTFSKHYNYRKQS